MKKIYILIFILLLSVILYFSFDNTKKIDPIGKNGVILAFGDSLTLGVGTSEEYSYPKVLEELCELKVINSGVSGETTREGLIRFPRVLTQTKPDLIILIEGGNDILRNVPYENIKNNIIKMVEHAINKNIPILLIGVPEKKIFSDAAPFYNEIAIKYDLPYTDSIIGSLLRSSEYKSDSIHFNKEGYQKMGTEIHQLLQKSGALD